MTTFVITGPNTLTATQIPLLNGNLGSPGATANTATQCLTDIFTVTGEGGSSTPVICGTNSGYHSKLCCSSTQGEINSQNFAINDILEKYIILELMLSKGLLSA